LVVKAGYVTNKTRYHKTAIRTAVGVVDAISGFRNAIYGEALGCYYVPYLIVQPCMINRLEKKIVCLNGKYCYTMHPPCSHALGHKYRYSGNLEERYKFFAENAIRVLAEKEPLCILDGLVRVDIFETVRNDDDDEPIWVVNEIESLEAVYSTPDSNAENKLRSGLTDYWSSILSALIEDYHSSSNSGS
jgi:hypothetical protein